MCFVDLVRDCKINNCLGLVIVLILDTLNRGFKTRLQKNLLLLRISSALKTINEQQVLANFTFNLDLKEHVNLRVVIYHLLLALSKGFVHSRNVVSL